MTRAQGLFWLFWGAKKGGTFLGRAPKKPDERGGQGAAGWNQALPLAILTPSPLAPCGRGAAGEGARRREQGELAEQNKGDFFGVHPKKSQNGSRSAACHFASSFPSSCMRVSGNYLQQSCEFAGTYEPGGLIPRTLPAVDGVRFIPASTRGCPAGSTRRLGRRIPGHPQAGAWERDAKVPLISLPLCDAKYHSKIFCRNLPSSHRLQQTGKNLDRDLNPACYTRARKEFRGIW